ncbi:proteasome subunit alpha, partial [Kitasatospora sp. NPDC059463]
PTHTPHHLEVEVRHPQRFQQRKFKRILGGQLARLLDGDQSAESDDSDDTDGKAKPAATPPGDSDQ